MSGTGPLSAARAARFEAFIAANPHVYAEVVRRTRALVASGFGRLGIRMIWEALRHDWMLEVDRRGDVFKLNDHYTAPLARLVMEREPDLRGVFEVRGRT